MTFLLLLHPSSFILPPCCSCASRTHDDRKRPVALLRKPWGVEALHLCHFFGLWSFRALCDLELNLLTLFESLEAVALNGAVVNEDVGRAWLFNEAVALRVVKPLELTGYSRHNKRILLTIR